MSYLEDWDFYKALWFSIVTVSTVGYGDHYPITDGGKIFVICFIIFSLGAFAFVLGAFLLFLFRDHHDTDLESLIPSTRKDRARKEKGYICTCDDRTVQLFAAFFWMVGLIAIAMQIFFWTDMATEDTTWVDAFYWACVTLGTVGYGDFYPVHDDNIGYTMVLIVFGCPIFAFCIALIAACVVNAILVWQQRVNLRYTIFGNTKLEDLDHFKHMDDGLSDCNKELLFCKDQFAVVFLATTGQVSTNFIDRVVKAYKRFTLAHASRQFKIARDDKKFQLTMDGSTTMKTMDPKIKDAVSKAKTCEEWVMAQGWKKQNEWSHTETPAAVYSTFDALIKSLKNNIKNPDTRIKVIAKSNTRVSTKIAAAAAAEAAGKAKLKALEAMRAVNWNKKEVWAKSGNRWKFDSLDELLAHLHHWHQDDKGLWSNDIHTKAFDTLDEVIVTIHGWEYDKAAKVYTTKVEEDRPTVFDNAEELRNWLNGQMSVASFKQEWKEHHQRSKSRYITVP